MYTDPFSLPAAGPLVQCRTNFVTTAPDSYKNFFVRIFVEKVRVFCNKKILQYVLIFSTCNTC